MGRELKPAKELGITTIGLVTNEARENELREASDFLISNIKQLQNLLTKDK
jgi:FMN phosphatase YigB (HAD superfamily)